MVHFLLKLLVVLCGMAMYVKGETDTKLLGTPDKRFKYFMGIPIALIGCLAYWSVLPLLCVLSYYIGANFGYGENNPLTKILGKQGAIMFCGFALGLASFPILGYWALMQAAISCWAFGFIHILDDNGKVKEPFVAILRSLSALCLLLLK